MRFNSHISVIIACFWLAACIPQESILGNKVAATSELRPNILLIVADDMGFSDLGAFGGEAHTPNLDKLAMEGTRLTAFHSAPSCSPARAQMLGGVDNHLIGLGNMGELLFMYPWQKGKPGYEGYLNHRAITIASVLQEYGYRTYMTGKWHMGHDPDLIPTARGFDRSYALMNGTSSHYQLDNGREGHPTILIEDKNSVSWPHGKYSTDQYTDKLLEYLQLDANRNQPFFAYMAYTAPHFPLHAPQETIEKYRGKYDAGYEALLEQRLANMRNLGVIPDSNSEVSSYPKLAEWKKLSEDQKQRQRKRMEVYTAMIDHMDHNVGRILSYLEKSGELKDTMIIFISDNGASGEEPSTHPIWKPKYSTSNNAIENIGRADSWTSIGAGWAHAVTAPYRASKHYTAQGGIHVPAIVWLPGENSSGRISNAFVTIRDIAPTLLDYAGISLPEGYFSNRNFQTWTGKSLLPMLMDETNIVHTKGKIFGWEHRERFALIKGDWKLLQLAEPYGTGEWELINLADDPGETTDLSNEYPDKFVELQQAWLDYVRENGVVIRE